MTSNHPYRQNIMFNSIRTEPRPSLVDDVSPPSQNYHSNPIPSKNSENTTPPKKASVKPKKINLDSFHLTLDANAQLNPQLIDSPSKKPMFPHHQFQVDDLSNGLHRRKTLDPSLNSPVAAVPPNKDTANINDSNNKTLGPIISQSQPKTQRSLDSQPGSIESSSSPNHTSRFGMKPKLSTPSQQSSGSPKRSTFQSPPTVQSDSSSSQQDAIYTSAITSPNSKTPKSSLKGEVTTPTAVSSTKSSPNSILKTGKQEEPEIYKLSSSLANTYITDPKVKVIKTLESGNSSKSIPSFMLKSSSSSPQSNSETTNTTTPSPKQHSLSTRYQDSTSNPSLSDLQVTPSPNFSTDSKGSYILNSQSVTSSCGISEQAFESYSKNAKKTKDPEALLDYAQILIRRGLTSPSSTKEEVKRRKSYFEEAHEVLKRAVKVNYVEAQYYLGDAYSVGIFGKPDETKALAYFEAAGKNKHAESAYRTAVCYRKGWGCKPDARKVVKYLGIASLNNHPVAMMEYGIYCFHGLMGLGDDTNTKKQGISWLRRATEVANELSAGAPYELGLIHLNGFKDIVIRDTNYAVKLFFQAANFGHAKSALMLGKIYEIGDIVEANSDLSIHFYNMAADLGDTEGMMGLCSWYFVGAPHLEKDYDEAFAWALRAAEKGSLKAMLSLQRFYEMGIGCEKDLERAKHWSKLADDAQKR